jgi:hypothetical protein
MPIWDDDTRRPMTHTEQQTEIKIHVGLLVLIAVFVAGYLLGRCNDFC